MSVQVSEDACPICTEPVVDEGEDGCVQDALFCEGVCKRWHHRWCACVTKERYSVLSDSEEPFLCPSCTSSNQQAAIISLQNCLKALTDEVRSLKATVASIHTQAPTATPRAATAGDPASKPRKSGGKRGISTPAETPWNVVVRRGKRNPGSKSKSPPKDSHAEPQPSHSSHHTDSGHESRPKNRMPVKGARKIWGTLRQTTSSAIQNTLKALTKSGSNGLTVKRKFKTALSDQNRVMKWWFVVRGEEQLLEQLQDEWPAVYVQTSWRLEPVLSYATTADDPGTTTAEKPTESGERSAVNSSSSGAGHNDSAHENNGGEAMTILGPEVVELQNNAASNHPGVSDPSFLGEQ